MGMKKTRRRNQIEFWRVIVVFLVQKVKNLENWEMVAREMSLDELSKSEEKRGLMEKSLKAYWTTLAPIVEDYSSCAARMIAVGQLIRGILWCGVVTVDRLKWGDAFLRKRMGSGSKLDISPETLKRLKRVKKLTKMSENMATGVL